MSNGNSYFLRNLGSDSLRLWGCRSLIVKPILFTAVLLAFTYFLKMFVPWIFMDLGFKDEAYGATVIVAISLPHGVLLGRVFPVIWEQNENIMQALRNNQKQLFLDNFYRRIPVQMKVLIFSLSVCIVYSVASCDFGNIKNNMVALGITLFVIILAWMAAYEMDDPFSAVWNIRHRIPDDWWKEIEKDIEIIPGSGKVRLRDIFQGADACQIEKELIDMNKNQS